MKNILFIILILFVRLCGVAQELRLNFVDTLMYQQNFKNTTLDSSIIDKQAHSSIVLFADCLYSIIESEPCNILKNRNWENCIIESNEKDNTNFYIKYFYQHGNNAPITISEAMRLNKDFTFFVLNNHASKLIRNGFTYTAYSYPYLFVQNDIQYSDSISNFFIGIVDTIAEINNSFQYMNFQQPISRLVIYESGIKKNFFSFINDSVEYKAFPIGLAIYNKKILIAGYNSFPKKRKYQESNYYLYFIDIATNKIILKKEIPNIQKFAIIDDYLIIKINTSNNLQFLRYKITVNG